ncbi:DNA methyltransferase [uncultured Desulfosarcina sp.]|uniref:DNA methyltransferase n=1 Tax=uncultured Desulfosarcina sp. TaxID=218289 RepID=UPI0029C72832|nr:DNA methyltransferase [uncultured Desulfosarcina sp.]
MKTNAELSVLIKAHKETPPGMMFYDSLESVHNDINLLGYVSVVDRAWKELKIDGVLCLDCRPILYFKESGRPLSLKERLRFQKRFWNQGVANILVLADPTFVYIYSGLTKPRNDKASKELGENALIETLKRADYTLRIRSLFHKIASGCYYEENRPDFDPDQTVDAWLLDNLRALRNSLIKGEKRLSPMAAHAFIGRVLFLCYLLDRGIVSIGTPSQGQSATMLLAKKLEDLPSFESRLSYFYDLFSGLKTRFNGNMFDQNLENEKTLIFPVHLEKLSLFLGGHEVESGQRHFGFWPYDFKMIPVETISAIYEDFLSSEDPEKQRGKGAFYTPRFLAEMVVDTAVKDNPAILDGCFLDPACGSGIFLVLLFNRLANRWIHAQTGRITYSAKAKALRNILKTQIRGVDVEETACRIACFSLYLAYLDFFNPPDIQKHVERTGKPLPKLLDYGDIPDRPTADIPVILKADFLSEKTLSKETFTCIIGNPPWKGRGSKQIAQKFIQKAPDLLENDGTGCLLLPTKILQNQTNTFQGKWLKKITLELVLQLADYSFLLFQNALCPAFIARFKNTSPQIFTHKIEFNAPKFNRDGLRKGVVPINPSSQIWLPLVDILTATKTKTAPILWKRRLWGTPRDQKLLDLLQALPSLNDHVDVLSELRKKRESRSKRWITGEGIKPWPLSKTDSDRAPKTIRWPDNMAFIEARPWNSDLLILKEETILLLERLKNKNYRTDVFYSQPPKELFDGPIVLFSRGFDKIAYCDFNVVFQHALRSISGPVEDSNLLIFLSVYLRSNLARYYLFHVSTSWGTERDQVHLNEVLRVPFPLPGHEFISPDSEKILKQVVQKFHQLETQLKNTYNEIQSEANHRSLLKGKDFDFRKQWQEERTHRIDKFQDEIEPLLYQYFGLTDQEIMLVEDTFRIFEPSSTPTTRYSPQTTTLDSLVKTSVEPYAANGLGVYANTLTRTLNSWAETEGSQYRVKAKGGVDENTGLAMVTVDLAEKESEYEEKSISQELVESAYRFQKVASNEHGTLLYQRDILVFQGKQIHIIRPDILINWTRTAALNDAARIYGEIVQSREAFNA